MNKPTDNPYAYDAENFALRRAAAELAEARANPAALIKERDLALNAVRRIQADVVDLRADNARLREMLRHAREALDRYPLGK